MFSVGCEPQIERLDLTSCSPSLSSGQKKDTVTNYAKAIVPVLHLAVSDDPRDILLHEETEAQRYQRTYLLHVVELEFDSTSV